MATATETFALGGEQVTVPIHFGEVFYIDALTAPWDNEFFGPWHPSGYTGNWLNLQAGSTPDQTATIQAQIDAIPDGILGAPNVIRFPVGMSTGKYFTQGNKADNARGKDGVLLFRNRHHLILEGPSRADPATLYTAYPAVSYNAAVGDNTHSLRRHLWFQGCTDITVRDSINLLGSNHIFADQLSLGDPVWWRGGLDTGGLPTTRGYRAPWELEHAYAFDGCDGVYFEGQCQDVWGDGLYLGNYTTGKTKNVYVGAGSLVGTGRQGVAISRASDVVIDGLKIGTAAIRPRRAGFDLEPVSTWVVERVEIKNCAVFMGSMTHIAALGHSRVDDIKIHHNLFTEGAGKRVDVGASDGTPRKNWNISHNVWTSPFGSPAEAMRFKLVNGVTIENNDIPIATTQSRQVARFTDCPGDLIVKDNRTPGGLWVDHSGSSIPQLINNTPALTLRP